MSKHATFALILVCCLSAGLMHQARAQDVNGGTGLPQPVGYFTPKYPYTENTTSYPFAKQLDTPYACKYGANIPGADQYQAVLTLSPCNYITEHYHPEAHEFNHVLNGGPLKYAIILSNGSLIYGSNPVGSTMMLPMGLTHIVLNDNCVPTSFFHYFPVTDPIFMFTVASIVHMPDRFKVSTFGPTGLELNLTNIPDGIHTLDQTCMKRCNLTPADFAPTGKFGAGLCKQLNAAGF